jgi:hypothetical protein
MYHHFFNYTSFIFPFFRCFLFMFLLLRLFPLLLPTHITVKSPNITFYPHLQVDPFWRPTSEDERDEHGEAYASHEAGLRLI